jgi:predicted lipoprotein with Yx(FWY)xxD motif
MTTFAALGLCCVAATAWAQDYDTTYRSDDPPELRPMSSLSHGRYVGAGDGRALYILTEDRNGISYCNGPCTVVWPPLLVDGDEPLAGFGLNPNLVGSVERADGSLQVTYAGWPLYRYARDDDPGDTHGHHVEDRWGEWLLISPEGRPKGMGRPLYYESSHDD